MDYFSLFNLPIDYQIDIAALAPRYQELQRQYHPDRFAAASESEQMQAMQTATTVNQAYQTLKHPLRRAEYILSLQGFDVQNEQQTMHDTVFLMEQLELREELDAIERCVQREPEKGEAQLQQFNQRISDMIAARSDVMIGQLADAQWQTATDTVRKLRFLDKLQQQIEQIEDKLFDA
jgi:molecular chaperone HscB